MAACFHVLLLPTLRWYPPIKPISSWLSFRKIIVIDIKKETKKKNKIVLKTFLKTFFAESANFPKLLIWQDHVYLPCYSLEMDKTLYIINTRKELVLQVLLFLLHH